MWQITQTKCCVIDAVFQLVFFQSSQRPTLLQMRENGAVWFLIQLLCHRTPSWFAKAHCFPTNWKQWCLVVVLAFLFGSLSWFAKSHCFPKYMQDKTVANFWFLGFPLLYLLKSVKKGLLATTNKVKQNSQLINGRLYGLKHTNTNF